jgi:hypothetical protein
MPCDSQRSSLRLNVVDHDLSITRTRNDLFAVRRESDTPDLEVSSALTEILCTDQLTPKLS